ncbi:MAG: phosphatidate cytidylyltransferase [Butyrivibrio sp.]|nr:phosphatidate cytidylyltransferase [Butyrivibrio sp.]
MKIRVISGIALGIMLAVTLFGGGYLTAGVLLIVSLLAYHELASALSFSVKNGDAGRLEVVGMAAIILHYLLMVITGGDMKYFVMLIMLLFVANAAIIVFDYPKISSDKVIASVFSFVYAPMMLSFIYLLRIMPNGKFFAWIPFIAWVCDTCAYFAGNLLGKHKLCPKLSPKKTVEGAVGGVLGSALVGVLFGYIYANYGNVETDIVRSVVSFVIITVVASAISQIGDLIASAIKRDHDIKDYGKVIPGHGGIMDRFDSVIFITPVIYFMATYFFK